GGRLTEPAGDGQQFLCGLVDRRAALGKDQNRTHDGPPHRNLPAVRKSARRAAPSPSSTTTVPAVRRGSGRASSVTAPAAASPTSPAATPGSASDQVATAFLRAAMMFLNVGYRGSPLWSVT